MRRCCDVALSIFQFSVSRDVSLFIPISRSRPTYAAKQIEQAKFEETSMKRKKINLLIAIAFVFTLSLVRSEGVFARDKKFTPEEVVAAHLKSIGDPELLASIKSRGMNGKTSVEFVQGGVGTMTGKAIVISSGHSLSIILKYGGVDYPGEYFAFDGTDVEVSTIRPGQRSPLGDFIYRYKEVMKEGLLGGVLSLGWPLLDIEKKSASLRYVSAKVNGRELHEIDYKPRRGMNNVKVKLFFEPSTFRHVRTEYMLNVQGEQALQAGQTVTRGVVPDSTAGQRDSTITRDAGILDKIGNSYYLLVEKFDSFKEVKYKDSDGSETRSLILPHSYVLEYSVEGQGSSFLAHWNIAADQWMHNGKIDPLVFKVH
jgi:hypothetical protein